MITLRRIYGAKGMIGATITIVTQPVTVSTGGFPKALAAATIAMIKMNAGNLDGWNVGRTLLQTVTRDGQRRPRGESIVISLGRDEAQGDDALAYTAAGHLWAKRMADMLHHRLVVKHIRRPKRKPAKT